MVGIYALPMRDTQNTQIIFHDFFRKSYRFLDNVEKYCTTEQATDDDTIRRTCIACWIPKATNTHSSYTILIASPLQQWLHKRDSLLRYTYLACFAHKNVS